MRWPLVLPLVLALLAGCATTDAAMRADAIAPTLTTGAGRMAPSLADSPFGRQVAEAVRTHPALGAEAARIAFAQAEFDSERAGFRPQVSLGADAGVTLVGSGTRRSTPVLQVSQLLFDGGATRSRSEAARARIVRSHYDRVGTAANLALAAVEAQYTLEHEHRLLALAERNLAIHREFLEQIEDRLDAGAGTEADLLTARSRLADATARSVGARGRLERAEAAFREVFGRSPVGRSTLRAAPVLPGIGDEELIRTSTRLRGLEAELEAADAAVAAAEAGRLPSVSLGVAGRRGVDRRAEVTADLSVRYDLPTDGQRVAAIRGAEARRAEVAAERIELERQIARALEFVRSDARTGRERLAAARAALDANAASVEAAREQFGVGRRSITQLLDAQRDFVAASEALAQAELDLALSGYAAIALTGDILDVFGITLPQVVPDE